MNNRPLMCLKATCLALLSTTAFYPGNVLAATYNSSGECPQGFQIPRDAGLEVFTIVGQPELYVGAFDDTVMEGTVSNTISMHTKLRVIAEEEARVEIVSRKQLLDGRRICGWIDKSHVLDTDSQPIKVDTPVEWVDPTDDTTKTLSNPLELKALLRSNPEFETQDAVNVTIYERPSLESATRTSASVFGIYKVYAEKETPDGRWYWIAGEDPGYPTRFSGWIPEYHVMLWESQLSLHFGEYAEGSQIYASLDHALVSDGNGIIGSRPENFRERSIGPKPESGGDINIARFPILKEEPSPPGGERSIYRIGFFGNDNNLSIGGFEDDDSSRRAKIQQSVQDVDILFLLDNTLSMTEYFPSAVESIQKASEAINNFNIENGYKIKVKFAAAIYGDYTDQNTSVDQMQFEIVSRLGRPGNTRHLEKLTRLADKPDSHFIDFMSDLPEAGLGGIIRAIDDLQWTSDTLFKVIVWIGDHGSRNVGNREWVGVEDVQQALVDNNVLILPINVSGRYDPVWNFQFIEQGDQIAADGRGLVTQLAHDGSQTNDYQRAGEFIQKSIATMYQSSLLTMTSLREQTDIVQTLEENPELLELEIPTAQADVLKISQSICQMAFGDNGCQVVQQSGQFMGEGFVSVDNSAKAFSFWVNLNETQLQLLQQVLESTCTGFERGNVKKYVENAMTLVQNAMGGDRYRTDIPVGEYLRRFFLLPRGHFPSFLESTPDRIDEAWQEARDIDSDNGNLNATTTIADPICRSSRMLDLVLNDLRVQEPAVDVVRTASITGEETYSWSVANEKDLIPFDWEWAQGGENNYLYIPVEYLPGRIPVN